MYQDSIETLMVENRKNGAIPDINFSNSNSRRSLGILISPFSLEKKERISIGIRARSITNRTCIGYRRGGIRIKGGGKS